MRKDAFTAVAVLALAILPPAARAGQIGFGATCESFGCPPGSYVSANSEGAQGFGPIYFIDSYRFPVTGGSITFTSEDATKANCAGFPPVCTYGFGGGGDFLITGSAFGLPAGSTLIAGMFIAGGIGVGEPYGSSFNADFQATYINPVVLENMGFPSDFTLGKGSLDAYDSGGFPWSATLTVTPSPSPEPTAAWLLALGLIPIFARRIVRLPHPGRATDERHSENR